MIVFRLSKSRYSFELSGKGAEKYGGRWNSKGVPMIYTSASRALCTVEIAVHTPLGNIPFDYQLVVIEIPVEEVEDLSIENLRANWNTVPHTHHTQEIGDDFIKENKSLVLKVPAAVVKGEHNYLINPNHKHFHKIRILEVEDFSFDQRMFIK